MKGTAEGENPSAFLSQLKGTGNRAAQKAVLWGLGKLIFQFSSPSYRNNPRED